MNYWLFKSEPGTWSWDDQVAKGAEGEEWNGVRNYQARNNMRAMALGDRGFFYHSVNEKRIMGVVEVSALCHPDSTTEDPRWECVDIRAVGPFATPITLEDCKRTPGLEKMILVNNSRLSVQPVSPEEWDILCRMGGFEG
ncbi:EVE domain-containing protein [Oceanicella sp. SM1341]|uniref:EVE domain-containing protein n=1 Tax=Oceanicella sp. SM1341 TaxID=1548889 RepID=UPI000E4A4ED9|nr:EVE domain-containing protein [Oceanicella sp. SM1341]